MSKVQDFIIRYFYLGNFKYAPGTFASFCIMLVWFFIPNELNLQLFLILFHVIIGLYFCYSFSNFSSVKDPPYIVIDEVVGMMISLFLLPKTMGAYILAFILFRAFDILKPSIINRSQHFKYGIGIMVDDIIAGVLTLLILQGVYL